MGVPRGPGECPVSQGLTMGAQEPIPIGCSAIKPVERHGLEALKHFLYDPDTGAILSRTPKSWALITIFYIINYSCLAAFWCLCLFIFFQFIDNDQPRWQQENSLIGRSPALGVRPGQDWTTSSPASSCSTTRGSPMRSPCPAMEAG